MSPRRTFRLSDEEYTKLQQQAKQLGLNASEYIRLIISLDCSTNIVETLKSNRDYKPRGLKQFEIDE